VRRVRRSIVVAMFVVLASCSHADVAPGDGGVSTDESSSEAVVAVRQADFQITYKLDGVSATSRSVGLLSNQDLRFVPRVDAGTTVSRGQTIGTAAIDAGVKAALEAGAPHSSIDMGLLERLRGLEGLIAAPVAGVLTLDGVRPVVSSPGIDVVVPLTPIQDLRYQSLRFVGEASIETIVGERTVVCEAIWTQAPQGDEESEDGPPAESAELHCRLPNHIETAAGLRARITLTSELIPEAVVVPDAFIGYDETTDGYFITVLEDAQNVVVPVVVGATDGVVRVITSDVPIGAKLVPLGTGR
jgi:hypothetical protein